MMRRNPAPHVNTQKEAGSVAARFSGERYRQILDLLKREGPLAIFEIALKLKVPDNRISGRFSELNWNGLIEMAELTVNPSTGCKAWRWKIARNPETLFG